MKHETVFSVILVRQAYICLLGGGSELIFRETVALSPGGVNRAYGSTAILPASLARPSGGSESICRETVALSLSPPPPVQAWHPSSPCEARHATLGFFDIRLRRKYGSRLSASGIFAYGRNTVAPRPCKPSGLHHLFRQSYP